MAKSPKLTVSLSQLETRFIFKAIAFAMDDKRLPVREKDLLNKIAAGLYAEYVKVYGEPSKKDLGVGVAHQPHCRAPQGFVCSCVKAKTFEETL